jgi:hypothetical protein
MRRHILLAAAPACALLVFSPFAARADIIKAPEGKASAVAAQVGQLLDISKTSAVANEAKPTAEASVIRLFGQTLLGLGGTQEGDGEKKGALLDTGANNPIRLEVAPWAAAVEGTQEDTRKSKASAALVKANVANVVRAALLHSESKAEWTDLKSSGSAFSNGVELGLLGDAISVVLLHSEVKSDGQGSSYLVGLNGTEIGTDEQLGKSQLCSLSLQSLLSLSCLKASGGGAPAPGETREAASQVAQVDPALEAISILDPVGAFTTASSSGGGAPAVTLPAAPAPAPEGIAASEDTRAPDTVAAAPALPRTGAAIAGLIVFGLVALLGGAVLRLVGRRRVTA